MEGDNEIPKSINGNIDELPNVSSVENSATNARRVTTILIICGVLAGIIACGTIPALIVSQVLSKTTTKSSSSSTLTSSSGSITSSSSSSSSSPTTTGSTTSTCPVNTCAYSTWYTLTSSGYYGVEHVDINCTQTLLNFTAFIYVQTTVGATFANEYNTFWSGTVNQMYSTTNSQIIYSWLIITGQTISSSAFPVYVEAQFQLQGTNQTVTSDTYTVITQSACNGQLLTYSGYF